MKINMEDHEKQDAQSEACKVCGCTCEGKTLTLVRGKISAKSKPKEHRVKDKEPKAPTNGDLPSWAYYKLTPSTIHETTVTDAYYGTPEQAESTDRYSGKRWHKVIWTVWESGGILVEGIREDNEKRVKSFIPNEKGKKMEREFPIAQEPKG